jgi:cellulose synthase/poly-beta-1,6-N-acetylglucosamine synthase-like glycosyltransferase
MEAPDIVDRYFSDPQIGGMQLQVRIYNRQNWLTWLQDLEFSVFGDLFQAGRSCWRSACMGGSGQINRLSALDTVQGDDGPWMDRLTEDQDLSMRLMTKGWQMVHSNQVNVHQQGLSKLKPLLRQRTRWAQGNLEIVSLCRQLWGAPISRWAKWELTGFVLSPLLQICVGIALLGAIGLTIVYGVDPVPADPWALLLFSLLAFSGISLGLYSRARGDAWKTPFLLPPYLLYTWILWPVLVRASLRILLSRNSWSKTEREALAEA